MALTSRPPDFDSDLAPIAALVHASAPTTRHRVDFPWRLSNPAIWRGADARLWLDEQDVPVAFAAWQQPWATLDFCTLPGPRQAEAEVEIFAWAKQRFGELDRLRGRPLPYWVEARDDDAERLHLLERQGYRLDDDYAYLILRHNLCSAVPAPELPAGFAIRPLAGIDEVEDYAALHRRTFASGTMSTEWRALSLRMPRYRPELDLVAVASHGRLAGFCVAWYSEAEGLAQIEPAGIDPEFQRRGLGKALLREVLQRLQQIGAEAALVETETSRSAARAVYAALGFRPVHRALRKGQWFS